MENIDYRTKSIKDLQAMAKKFATKEKANDDIINAFAKVAVFHSIKDGQITPARYLLGMLGKTRASKEVSHFIQKFGNIGWGKLEKDGKAFGAVFKNKLDCNYSNQEGLDNALKLANQIFENLPNIWDVMENAPSELKDYNLHNALVRMASEIRSRIAAGKMVIVKDDAEQKLLDKILLAIPQQAA